MGIETDTGQLFTYHRVFGGRYVLYLSHSTLVNHLFDVPRAALSELDCIITASTSSIISLGSSIPRGLFFSREP
jgi:hypothetical protein